MVLKELFSGKGGQRFDDFEDPKALEKGQEDCLSCRILGPLSLALPLFLLLLLRFAFCFLLVCCSQLAPKTLGPGPEPWPGCDEKTM
jgi:hypothetical protein